MSSPAPAKTPTPRVVLKAGGMIVTQFLKVDINRDLQDMAGRFELTVFDQARVNAAGTDLTYAPSFGGVGGTAQQLTKGMECQISMDGTLLLDGWIEAVHTHWSADRLETTISGRDKTGDLVDCAAVPFGPAEFKNVTLTQLATTLCKPFGIPVTADVDVGAPFVLFACGPHETVLAALEKAARQRAVLLVSDGIGGLRLTQGGSSRAPAPLVLGGNVFDSDCTTSDEHRFSDVFVKGQTANALGARKGVPAYLTPSVEPGDTPTENIAPEASAIIMTGHATDPQITRWRPTVKMTRTQSGMSTVQAQAEWHVRVARGQADRNMLTVLDWRANPAGPTGTLWLPNQVSAVFEPFAGINDDMLIAGCHYTYDERGLKAVLRVVGVTAYDLVDEAAKKQPRRRGGTPQPLTVPDIP